MLGSKWFSFVLFSLYFWFAAGCALGDLHVASIEPSVVQALRQLPTKSGA